MNKIILYILCIGVFFTCCQSLEDTYEEYAGNGKTRYVGKCKNLKIKYGWKRFELSWENSLDKTVEKIEIVCSASDYSDTIILPADATSYNTDAIFENKVYTFDFYAVDIDNNHSLKTSISGRPYTYGHDDIKLFNNIERKYFLTEDKIILFFNTNPKVTNSSITYFNTQNEEKTLELSKDIIDEGIYTIDNVDISKDVTVNRSAVIENCIDLIEFPSYNLSPNFINMNSDIKEYLINIYNINGDDEFKEFVNNQEELHFNYDISSFEDLFYFPNLKKLVLGKERYMCVDYKYDAKSRITDADNAEFILNTLNQLKGLNVDIYNGHYYPLSYVLPFANKFEVYDVPKDIIPLNTEGWKITCSSSEEGYNDNVESLLDNDSKYYWEPAPVEFTVRNHEIIIDMQEIKPVKGIIIAQAADSYVEKHLFAGEIELFVSDNGYQWRNASNKSTVKIGKGRGEKTIIYPKDKSCRYIKVNIKDQLGYRKFTYLGDITVF